MRTAAASVGRGRGVLLAALAWLGMLVPLLPADAQERPVEDLLVAPDGARLVTSPRGAVDDGSNNFLESMFPELDAGVQARALAIVERGDERVMLTVLRLGTASEASEALALFGSSMPSVETRPPVLQDTVARFARIDGPGDDVPAVEGTIELYEAGRATGSDLVVLAQIAPFGDGPSALVRDTMHAHVDAFPTVTPPSRVPHRTRGWETWQLVAGLAAAAGLTLLALRTLGDRVGRGGPRRRSRSGSSQEPAESRLAAPPPADGPARLEPTPPGTTSSNGARVNW